MNKKWSLNTTLSTYEFSLKTKIAILSIFNAAFIKDIIKAKKHNSS